MNRNAEVFSFQFSVFRVLGAGCWVLGAGFAVLFHHFVRDDATVARRCLWIRPQRKHSAIGPEEPNESELNSMSKSPRQRETLGISTCRLVGPDPIGT